MLHWIIPLNVFSELALATCKSVFFVRGTFISSKINLYFCLPTLVLKQVELYYLVLKEQTCHVEFFDSFLDPLVTQKVFRLWFLLFGQSAKTKRT